MSKLHHRREPVVIMSIGVDGERCDQIGGMPKPDISLTLGDYVVTSESAMRRSGACFELIEVFEHSTIMGRPILAKALRSGAVELLRPGDNREVSEILSVIRSILPHATILIDGAADRLTQVASCKQAGFFVIMRIEPTSLTRCIEKLRLLYSMGQILSCEEQCLEYREQQIVWHSGALTSSKYTQLPRDCQLLILDDFTKVFLSYREFQSLLGRCEVRFRHTYEMFGLVVILRDLTQHQFLAALRDHALAEQILFNPYTEA
jgi:hypothetical protein